MPSFDLLVTNATLHDGSGAEPTRADVGISGDTIAAVGDLGRAEAAMRIDARGTIACPGFVDIHSHSDLTLLVNPRAESKIHQGVTTEVVGQCGFSPHPVRPQDRAALDALCPFIAADVAWTWEGTAQYLDTLRGAGLGLNVGAFVGHTAIRAFVMGFENRPASADEVTTMQDLLRRSFAEGALGFSFGLWYPLGSFAAREELDALAAVAAERGRPVSVHMRSEAAAVLESLDEMLAVARAASEMAGRPLRLQIDHLKASGRPAWGLMPRLLEAIERARDEGTDIAFDTYSYSAGSRHLSGSFPAWAQDGGMEAFIERLQWPDVRARLHAQQASYERGEAPDSPIGGFPEEIMVVDVGGPRNADAIGKRLTELGEQAGKDPLDAACDLLVAEKGFVTVVTFTVHEDDLRLALKHPLACYATDGPAMAPYGPLARGKPHPRCYGTYPRIFGRYVRDEGLLSLPEAIRKATAAPAERLGLTDRGLLREGHKADLVIFDPATITDTATFADPHRYPEGIAAVIVNGKVTVEKGEQTGAGAGEILTG